MEIYLIRHGETEWNRLHKLQGHTDIPLNDVGLAEARKASRNISDINFDYAMASPLNRAKKTAEILLGNRDCPLKIEELLTEISFGIGEGVNLRDDDEENRELRERLTCFFKDPAHYIPVEGGENIHDLKIRSSRFLKEILVPMEKERNYERVLVVAHGAMLRGILDTIQNLPDERFWEGPLAPNCGGAILNLSNGNFEILKNIDLVNLDSPREIGYKDY